MRTSLQKTKVNGDTIRMLLTQKDITQREAGKSVGVSHFTICRWSQTGIHAIPLHRAKKVANMLDVPLDALNKELQTGLTEHEKDWLEVFRKMTPLQQAQARVSAESILANYPHDTSSRDD